MLEPGGGRAVEEGVPCGGSEGGGGAVVGTESDGGVLSGALVLAGGASVPEGRESAGALVVAGSRSDGGRGMCGGGPGTEGAGGCSSTGQAGRP